MDLFDFFIFLLYYDNVPEKMFRFQTMLAGTLSFLIRPLIRETLPRVMFLL